MAFKNQAETFARFAIQGTRSPQILNLSVDPARHEALGRLEFRGASYSAYGFVCSTNGSWR